MSKNRNLIFDLRENQALIEALRKFPCINQYDEPSYIEAEYLVHDFSDLEEIFRKLLDDLFPKVKQHEKLSNTEMENLLFDIRREMDHIHYHLVNAKSNRDVCPATASPVDDDPEDEEEQRRA